MVRAWVYISDLRLRASLLQCGAPFAATNIKATKADICTLKIRSCG